MTRLRRAATRLCIGLAVIGSTGAFADAGREPGLRPALLEVTLNGERRPEPVLFMVGPDGALYAPANTLSEWRMVPPGRTPISIDGEPYFPLSSLPDVRVRLREQEQAVVIDLPTSAFQLQAQNLLGFEDREMTRASTGAFLTDDVLAERVSGRINASGVFSTGLFTPLGVAQTGFIAGTGGDSNGLTRLETSWSIDRPSSATSLRIGDSISLAGPGVAPVRFAGVHYFRNYAMQPGFVTMPLPTAAGSATVPSVVDVYVNNILQSSRDVAPGPFELANIPVQSGGGTVQLVVRDLLGRQVVSEQSYYASTQLLRRGLHDFSYEAGFIRRDFGRRSNAYGEFMVSTSHRYGLSDEVTAEAILQASKSRQTAGVAVATSSLGFVQVGGSASLSRGEQGMGYRLAASFERRASSLSFGLLSEYNSRGYGFIGMSETNRPPRLTVQAFADMPLDRGSVGVNFLHRSLRDGPSESLAGIFGSRQLSSAATLQLYARHSVIGRGETTFGASMSFALGGRRSTYISSEYRGGRPSGEISFQDDAPVGVGGGFRTTASYGPVRRTEAAYTYNLPMATVGGQLARTGGATGLRLSASGSVGLIGGNFFASRRLGDSFASVRVGNYPGVRVYADNQLIGVTGSDGKVVVPALRPFERNVIRIDEADLPMDAMLDTTEMTVRPYARSGVSIAFNLRRERGVLLQVHLDDGSLLPPGAQVSVEGATEAFVTASGGEVYIPNLTGSHGLRATWGDQSCEFAATVPDNDDPQPRLDGLVCSGGPSLAAR